MPDDPNEVLTDEELQKRRAPVLVASGGLAPAALDPNRVVPVPLGPTARPAATMAPASLDPGRIAPVPNTNDSGAVLPSNMGSSPGLKAATLDAGRTVPMLPNPSDPKYNPAGRPVTFGNVLKAAGMGLLGGPKEINEWWNKPKAEAAEVFKRDLGAAEAGGRQATEQATVAHEGAEADLARTREDAILHPVAAAPKEGLTPEETTLHDLMAGDNGKPRVNPETGKPYSYLEAYTATKQAAQDVKPDVAPKGPTNDFELWHAQNPTGTAADWMKLQNKNRPPDKPGVADRANNARADKSYEFNSKQLETISTPITQAAARFSRLQDTLNQKTPQADALVAPELLTIMAGGQGSGLRMNEAEISRIVGGRTNWESLKAAVNKWQTDPSKGLSITDSQRAQIKSLIQKTGDKITEKQKVIDDAHQGLLESDDPKEHRTILADTHRKLDSIDSGSGAGPSAKPMSPEEYLASKRGK